MLIKNEGEMDAYIERRLQEWAEWSKTGNFLGIGYQRQSSIAMFQDGKTINGRKTHKNSLSANEGAEEMEKMIGEMAQYKPIIANCLRSYYLEQLSLRKSAKKLGISHAQYGVYLQMARSWLMARFC